MLDMLDENSYWKGDEAYIRRLSPTIFINKALLALVIAFKINGLCLNLFHSANISSLDLFVEEKHKDVG